MKTCARRAHGAAVDRPAARLRDPDSNLERSMFFVNGRASSCADVLDVAVAHLEVDSIAGAKQLLYRPRVC